MDISQLNFVLAIGTVAMQLLTAVFLAAYIFPQRLPNAAEIQRFVGKFGLATLFVLSLVGSLLTLVYSDILGFEPCPLCWWQRIFLYPQVILLGMALWKNEYVRSVLDFSLVLSIIGAGFALYHHALQMMPAGTLPCPATGPSCAQITFIEFGYVTFPMMAVALFGLIIVTTLILRLRERIS